VEKPKQNKKKRKKIKKQKNRKCDTIKKAGHVRDKVIIFSN